MIRSGLKRIGRKLLGRGKSASPEPANRPKPTPVSPKPSSASPAGARAEVPAEASAAPVVSPPAPKQAPPPPPPEEPAPAASPTGGSSFAALAALAAQGQLGEARHADQSGTDLEAYAERMRVNGREVELAGEGLNTADDGVQFVGPVDNESSRAKAAGQVLSIDQEECISCGTCVEQTEDVFFLGEDDKSGDEVKAEVVKQEGPMDLIQDAIDACPVTCIAWMGEDELEDVHSAGGR